MDFLALCNRLKLECGVSGSDMTTTVNQPAEFNRLITWINAAWVDIQNSQEDWDWMRTSMTFPTVDGQPTYTPTQIGLTDFGQWARNTFRNYSNPQVTITIASPGVITLASHNLTAGQTVRLYTTGALPTGFTAGTLYYVVSPTTDTFSLSATSGGSAINTSGSQSGTHTMTTNNVTTFVGYGTEIFMPYIEYDAWRDGYEYGAFRQVQTRPTLMTIAPDKSIGVAPFPADGYTVVGDYFRVASEMTDDDESPALPTQFHMAIVYRAMMFYGRYEAAPEVYQGGETEFNKLMRRIMMHQAPEVRAGRALA